MGENSMEKTLNEEQKKKLVEWMVDRTVDTDIDSQARTYRMKLLDGWGDTQVRETAE